MASHALPQVLHFISTRRPVNKFGIPANRVSVSITPSRSFGVKFDSTIAFPARQRFIPKAEVVSEGGSLESENAEGIDAVGTDVLEAEGDVKAADAAKPPRRSRVKLGDIMRILNSRAIEESEKVRPIPDLRTGDIVQIKLEVPENKRRLSIYKGIVISKQNAGIHTTIRIRRVIAGIGVEIVFPIYSPNVKEIRVVSHRKVRRARLYYLRHKLPRFCTFK